MCPDAGRERSSSCLAPARSAGTRSRRTSPRRKPLRLCRNPAPIRKSGNFHSNSGPETGVGAGLCPICFFATKIAAVRLSSVPPNRGWNRQNSRSRSSRHFRREHFILVNAPTSRKMWFSGANKGEPPYLHANRRGRNSELAAERTQVQAISGKAGPVCYTSL